MRAASLPSELLLKIVNVTELRSARSSSAQPDFTFTHSSSEQALRTFPACLYALQSRWFYLGPFVANNHLLLPFTLNENKPLMS